MDFDDIEALVLASEHGSILAAAKASGVARATLRRRLDRVERLLGRQAFITGTDGITLTAAGRVLVQEGEELLAARDRLVARAQAEQVREGVLRVLCEQFAPPELLTDLMVHFTQLLPDIRTELHLDGAVASRPSDHFDAIVHLGDRPLLEDGFTRVLRRVPLRVQASAAYLARHGTPSGPGDLSHHTVLHRVGEPESWPLVGGGGLVITPQHGCSDLFTLGLMAGRDMGLALLPHHDYPVHPSIDALETVLEDTIQVERCVRIDMPIPAAEHTAAARVVAVIQQFTPEFE